MTIEVSRIISPDLFVENGSLLLNRTQARRLSLPVPALGAITFLARKTDPFQKLQVLAAACGREAFSQLKSHDKSYQPWIFISDGPWQEVSRISQNHRLWGRHRELVKANPHGIRSDDVEIRIGKQVRFAGLIKISEEMIETAIESARCNTSHAIIFSRRSEIVLPHSIRQIFHAAFPQQEGIAQTSIDWLSLALGLCPLGDILLRVSGGFDDPEAAIDLISLPENLTGGAS